MASSSSSFSSSTTSTITSKFIGLLLLLSLQIDLLLGSAIHLKNQTSFRPDREIQKLRRVEAYLNRINKPSIKTIHVTKQTLLWKLSTFCFSCFFHLCDHFCYCKTVEPRWRCNRMCTVSFTTSI